jgi:hypothetical protein
MRKGQSTKMSSVNRALDHYDSFRREAWGHLGFDPELPLPSFGTRLLYGDVSYYAHFSGTARVYVSDDSSAEEMAFILACAKLLEMEVATYSHQAALHSRAIDGPIQESSGEAHQQEFRGQVY